MKSYNAKIKKPKSMRYLSRQILEDLYFEKIVPATTFCISIWGACEGHLFSQLEIIQKRAERMIHEINGKPNRVKSFY